MQNIVPKNDNQVMAQVLAYADTFEFPHDPKRMTTLVQRALGVSALAHSEVGNVDYQYAGTPVAAVIEGEVVRREKGDTLPLFDRDEYLNVLRKPESRQKVKKLTDLLNTYATLAEQIESKNIIGLTLEEARKHPNYLNAGGSEIAFRVRHESQDDGEPTDLVIRYSQLTGDTATDTGFLIGKAVGRAMTLTKGMGIEGLEQGVALSLDPPLVVTKFVEGKNIYQMDREERQKIPDEHWHKLEKTIAEASKAGISIDFNSDNFIYDQEVGFTILDYRLASRKPAEELSAANNNGFLSLKDRVLETETIKQN